MMDLRQQASRIAQQYGIPPALFMRLVNQESGWNPNIRSPAGAIGLTQLMPGTARGEHVDPTKPIQNLLGGARYLSEQYRKFGRWDLALSAYNSGPGGSESRGRVEAFPETQAYVKAIMAGGVPKATMPAQVTLPPVAGQAPQQIMAPQQDPRRVFAMQMAQAIMEKGQQRQAATLGAVLGLRQAIGQATTQKQQMSQMSPVLGFNPNPTKSPAVDSGGMLPYFSKRVAMLIAAVKRDGGNLYISSGYRSKAEQTKLWEAALKKYGSVAAARIHVAPPGRSNHEKGIAADLGGDLDLAHKLAAQFGLYFPMSWENWHIEPQGSRK